MTELPKMHKILVIRKQLWYGLLISFVLIFLFWIYKSAQHVAKTEQSNQINLSKLKMFSNKSECYHNFANEKSDQFAKFKLNDIQNLESTILNNSKGNNIFFHQTNCIHDGVIQLTVR